MSKLKSIDCHFFTQLKEGLHNSSTSFVTQAVIDYFIKQFLQTSSSNTLADVHRFMSRLISMLDDPDSSYAKKYKEIQDIEMAVESKRQAFLISGHLSAADETIKIAAKNLFSIVTEEQLQAFNTAYILKQQEKISLLPTEILDYYHALKKKRDESSALVILLTEANMPEIEDTAFFKRLQAYLNQNKKSLENHQQPDEALPHVQTLLAIYIKAMKEIQLEVYQHDMGIHLCSLLTIFGTTIGVGWAKTNISRPMTFLIMGLVYGLFLLIQGTPPPIAQTLACLFDYNNRYHHTGIKKTETLLKEWDNFQHCANDSTKLPISSCKN